MTENNDEMDTTLGAQQPIPDHEQVMPSKVKDLMQQMKSDRFIKIYIGGGIQLEPFQVSEALLTNASDYFVKALRNENMMGTEPGVLRFPEDGPAVQAWNVMLFWLVNKKLPFEPLEDKYLVLCVDSWVLGDKYLIPQFQNAIVKELVSYFRTDSLPQDKDLVNTLLRLTPAGSGIRQIIAEEVIYIIHSGIFSAKERVKSRELDTELKGSGIATSLLDAFGAFNGKDSSGRVFPRWNDCWQRGDEDSSKYLVVDGVDKSEEQSDSEMGEESDDDT